MAEYSAEHICSSWLTDWGGCLQVFRPHVLGWILTSQEALCQRCRVIEATTYATAAAGPEGRMPEDGKAFNYLTFPLALGIETNKILSFSPLYC